MAPSINKSPLHCGNQTAQETRMLHPQAQALLRLIEEKGVPPTHTLTPAQARAWYLERRPSPQPDAPHVAAVRALQARGPAGPIRLRSYRPLGTPDEAVLPVL